MPAAGAPQDAATIEQPARPLVPIAPIGAEDTASAETSSASPALPAEEGEGEDIVVLGRSRRGDPLEPLNAATFAATQAVDQAVVGPVALAYEKNVPSPLRLGLRNFLANLREPVVFVNYLLQLKLGKAAETAGRFALNSTVGIAGVMDVAKRKPFKLPLRRNNFANTLGFYGVKPGAFFFLPLIGPTTLRDVVGTVVDQLFVPIQPLRPAGGLTYTVPVGILSALDYRARIEPDLQRQRSTADPYAALRRDYLERRQGEIDALRGKRAAPPPRFVDEAVPASDR